MLICLSFTILTILNFLVCHWDLCLTAAGFLVYSIKATKWGKANAKALATVAGVIEHLNNTEVKQAIKAKSTDLPKVVLDAIEDAVNTADPKKLTPTASDVIVREATRLKD